MKQVKITPFIFLFTGFGMLNETTQAYLKPLLTSTERRENDFHQNKD